MKNPMSRLASCLALLGATIASAGHAAQIGGVVSAQADAGACADTRSVPSTTVQDSMNLFAYAACNGGIAEAQVRADATAPSIGLQANVGAGSRGNTASAFVSLLDTWTIGVPDGVAVGSTFTLPVSFHLEGGVSSDADKGRSDRYLDFFASFGSFQASGSITGAGPYDQTFAGLATFTNYGPSLPTVASFEATLLMYPLGRGSVDFFHTLSATVDLPPGFTLTSSSGVPLFAVHAVPEPETWALLLLGLGGIGARRIARRAT